MEGQIYIPIVGDTDLVNIPPDDTTVTPFIHTGESGNILKAKKHDNTILVASAGGSDVKFA